MNYAAFIYFILLIISSVSLAKSENKDPNTKKLNYEIISRTDDVIWGFDFLDDNNIIFTERSGRLKILNIKDKKTSEVKGLPKVWNQGQGGLLDVRVRQWQNNAYIFITYTEADSKNNDQGSTSLGVARLQNKQLIGFKKIFNAGSNTDEKIHFGSRIEFDDQNYLYITIGDRNERNLVQDKNTYIGKIIRFAYDKTKDPLEFYNKPENVKANIHSIGHRSPQGLSYDPVRKKLWQSEMGPRGGDELNLIQDSGNYGWPEHSYGREYWGPSIGKKAKKNFIEPVAYWVPSISPSAIHVYNGKHYPNWSGNIFMACLSGNHIRRIVLQNDKVIEQEVLLNEAGFRFRNIRSGSDQKLYFSTDSGEIAKILL